jgi:serine protease Do
MTHRMISRLAGKSFVTFSAGLVLALAPCALDGAPPVSLSSSPLELARQFNQAFIEVADQVSPSVVVISVTHRADYVDPSESEEAPSAYRSPRDLLRPQDNRRDRTRREALPRPRRADSYYDSQGSGIILREDGYLLTNRHVVDGAERIRVRLADGREFDAEVRGVDSRSDIAVLKIAARGLRPAPLGDSAATRVGEFAVAIGAPFELDYSVTIGHISAKGRSEVIDDPTADQDFLQTDANINPGNSGGPLVNLYGQVIGINTLIRGLHSGIGFAIPINLAREVADKLIAEGRFVRAWLGLGLRALRDAPEFRPWHPGLTNGLVVTEIKQNGPARETELRPGDVILGVDGRAVSNAQQLRNEIRSKPIGQTLVLDVQRAGKPLKVKLKTEAAPDDAPPAVGPGESAAADTSATFGLGVQSLTDVAARRLGFTKAAGVLVTEVERGSEAESMGIRPGNLITEINHQPVTNPKQFREALAHADRQRGVVVVFATRDSLRCEILRERAE